MIKRCSCTHEAQDKIHGKGLRVFNPTTKGARCTVCGSETATASKGKK